MKKYALFIVMLAGVLGFAFSAEKGALSLAIPSAMASDDGSKDKDSAKDEDSKDKDSAKDEDSKDKDSDKDKDKDKDGDKDSDEDSSCTCPPAVASCICADGSEGKPGPGSLPTAPKSLRSIHGGS